MFTFLCRLHIGGESLESPLLTEAERGVDAEGILHSTSGAQLPSLFTHSTTERRLFYGVFKKSKEKKKKNSIQMSSNKDIVRKGTSSKRSVQLGVCALE